MLFTFDALFSTRHNNGPIAETLPAFFFWLQVLYTSNNQSYNISPTPDPIYDHSVQRVDTVSGPVRGDNLLINQAL